MTDSRELLKQAIEHQRGGRAEAAEWLYRAVLALDADHAEAHHNLGIIEMERGQIDSGLDHLQRALDLDPEVGNYWLTLAEALLIAKRPGQALDVMDRAEEAGLDAPEVGALRQRIEEAFKALPQQGAAVDDASPQLPGAVSASGSPESQTPSSDQMVVTLGDGTRVKCPVDVRDRATYILVEQGDWCEPEVSFVRRFIEPGMSALDVGASHGVYALSLARRMGGRGRVVALEPIRAAFERLEQSLVENALQDTLTVIRAGLSNIAGEVDVGAQARRKPDNADADCGLEPAPMMTAKELMEGGRWPTARRLDFVRLNAGDQQLDILRHWPRELSEHSPLVMLRIDSGCSVNDAAKALAGFGMPLFRLVPSLGALVEYELGQPLDPGVRNLFTCTRERAEMLFRRGLIV